MSLYGDKTTGREKVQIHSPDCPPPDRRSTSQAYHQRKRLHVGDSLGYSLITDCYVCETVHLIELVWKGQRVCYAGVTTLMVLKQYITIERHAMPQVLLHVIPLTFGGLSVYVFVCVCDVRVCICVHTNYMQQNTNSLAACG